MNKYTCPHDEEHKKENKATRGFQVITEGVPESLHSEIVCCICGTHIKWESKAEAKAREAMTLGRGD